MKRINYEDWWRSFTNINKLDPGTKIRKEIILKEIQDRRFIKILDLGCGYGELLEYIKHIYPDRLLYGGDVSSVAINHLKGIGITEKLYKIDLNKSVQINEKFDVIIISELVEHLSNWKLIFTQLYGLLNNNGIVIVTTQSGKMYFHHKKVGHLQHFTKSEISNEFKVAGFKVYKAINIGWPFMDIKNILASRYLEKYDGKVRFIDKSLMKLFYYLYKISSKERGPQLIVVAKRL
jgi:cyclopropane fatty-acyl-phospholipid synthase-like methyltransferase